MPSHHNLALVVPMRLRSLEMRPPNPGEVAAADPSLRQADDQELVQAFQAGRVEAFDLLVERHRRTVYQLCYRFVGNHEDAADLAQDVFVRAFTGLSRFKGDSSIRTWLYRVSVNVSLNRVTAKRPATEPIDTRDHADSRAVDPLDAAARGQQAARVRQAIRRLPPKQRATLVLRVYQDLSYEEIAGVLGGTVGAVKANFFHALGNLKRMVRP
jgi:RNA polymerase sigma-70 factor (ECF subfamily)